MENLAPTSEESGMSKSITSLMAATFVAFVPLVANAQSRPSALPEGEAKVLVEGLCTMCHQTNMITASLGYTRDGWNELTGTMLDLSGNPDMRDKLIDYLATHFPPNTRRAPTLVSGPIQITLKEWVMPQRGSVRAIRSRRRTARSGTPASSAT
jgi:cytochrome c5